MGILGHLKKNDNSEKEASKLYFTHHVAKVGKASHFRICERISEVHKTVAIFPCFVQGTNEDVHSSLKDQAESIPIRWVL